MDFLSLARQIVKSSLQLGDESNTFDESTQLLGGLPEFNSLTITNIIAEIEVQLDCEVDDGELTAELFETLGSLANFIASKA